MIQLFSEKNLIITRKLDYRLDADMPLVIGLVFAKKTLKLLRGDFVMQYGRIFKASFSRLGT